MPAPYATVTDVTARWDGVLDTASVARVQAWLDDAHVILASRAPDLDARITTGSPTTELVRVVVCRVVLRQLNNPRGLATERVGDVGHDYTVDRSVAGRVGFTVADLVELGVETTAGASSVGTVSTHVAVERRGQRGELTPVPAGDTP